MPHIEIVVSPQGQSQIQTHGFDGATCRAGSRFVEQALGVTVREQLTPEFHQSPQATETTEVESS